MKKALAIAMALMAALAMAACAPVGELSCEADHDGVHVVAKNGASGSVTGDLSIKEGYGMCINHIVEKGTFHVKATDATGTVVFDDDITDNVADVIEVQGDFDLLISATDAAGTMDIIPYDIAAQAQAQSKLDESLKEAMSREAQS